MKASDTCPGCSPGERPHGPGSGSGSGLNALGVEGKHQLLVWAVLSLVFMLFTSTPRSRIHFNGFYAEEKRTEF